MEPSAQSCPGSQRTLPRVLAVSSLSLPPSLPPSFPLDGFRSADARSQALALLPLLPHRVPTITLTRPGPGSGTGGEHQPESLACGESGRCPSLSRDPWVWRHRESFLLLLDAPACVPSLPRSLHPEPEAPWKGLRASLEPPAGRLVSRGQCPPRPASQDRPTPGLSTSCLLCAQPGRGFR